MEEGFPNSKYLLIFQAKIEIKMQNHHKDDFASSTIVSEPACKGTLFTAHQNLFASDWCFSKNPTPKTPFGSKSQDEKRNHNFFHMI